MKIYETDDKVVISLKKSEVRFSQIYGDQQGFYLRFFGILPVETVCELEKALPSRGAAKWKIGEGYNMWGR